MLCSLVGSSQYAFGEAVIKLPRCNTDLQVVQLVAAQVPAQQGSSFMQTVCSKFPLPDLQHLKRVRKSTSRSGFLEVIVAAVNSNNEDSLLFTETLSDDAEPHKPALNGEVADFLTKAALEWNVVLGASHAPSSRELWEEWTKLWPITWRVPSAVGGIAAIPPLTAAEQTIFERHMGDLCTQTSPHCALNAAAIVDPTTDEVLAVAHSKDSDFVLDHAVMVAIRNVAERACRLWPSTDVSCSTLSSQSQNAESKDSKKRAREDDDKKIESRCLAEKPYLCTGYDCYVYKEPCAMCAMALVHSRIRRVIYCTLDPTGGALSGSFNLQDSRSLNHHYAVYQLPLIRQQIVE